MLAKHILPILIIAAATAGSVPYSSGQEFYSYINDNGVQVLTNMSPADVSDSSDPTALENKRNTVDSQSGSSIYDSIIRKYAGYYALDPSLIHSIIETESGFNPKAVSPKGARGLMQLMPSTAEQLGVEDSFDPEQNIQGGVKYFRSLMDMFDNNLNLSLAAYNAGENLVRQLGRIPQYEETINYVKSVTRRYKERRTNVQDNKDGEDTPTFRYVDASGVLHLTNIPPSH